MPLGNGCACCTVRVELQAALRRLLAERETAGISPASSIETQEDLAPILRTFATDARARDGILRRGRPAVVRDRDGIHSFVLTEDAPLAWDAFSRFIATLHGAARRRPAARERIAECRGLPRSRWSVQVHAAPRAAAGRAMSMPLRDGCACCTVREELQGALRDAGRTRAATFHPRRDRDAGRLGADPAHLRERARARRPNSTSKTRTLDGSLVASR